MKDFWDLSADCKITQVKEERMAMSVVTPRLALSCDVRSESGSS